MAKVLIMAGGTGGHVFPALAVAKALQQKGHSIIWMGTEQGIESRIVPENNIPLFVLNIKGMRASGWRRKLAAPWQIIKAVAQARKIIKAERPDWVIGMGGYASGPGAIAAKLAGIPILIHEQNTVPGLTNRIVSRFANRICEAFPKTFNSKSKQIYFTGNPVRHSICQLPKPEVRMASRDAGPLRILILGGSQGALKLNQIMPDLMAMIKPATGLQVWHQCGEKVLSETQQAYQAHGIDARTEAFIHNMDVAYAWADLVICRAGAMTIAEIAVAGIGSILIPYPYAVDDHQTRNAEYLAESKAAIIVQQQALQLDAVAEQINQLAKDRQGLIKMAAAAQGLAKPDATENIVRLCEEMAIE